MGNMGRRSPGRKCLEPRTCLEYAVVYDSRYREGCVRAADSVMQQLPIPAIVDAGWPQQMESIGWKGRVGV